MPPARGTYRAGRIELDSPVDWPDGARVAIVPADNAFGLSESVWQDTPAARQKLLADLDAAEPLEFGPQDEAEIAAARAAVRQASLEAVRKQMGLAS